MKNPLALVLQVTLVALVCLSCELFDSIFPESSPNNGTSEPDDGKRRTTIVFDNPNAFSVGVFLSSARTPESKIVDVRAERKSSRMDFLPQPKGYYFHFRYLVPMEGINVPIDYPLNGFEAIVKENITNDIVIPKLNSGASLTTDIYLTIANKGASAIRLGKGSEILEDIDKTEAINAGKSGVFRVSPGKAEAYRILSGADNYNFPEFDLESGNIYVIEVTTEVIESKTEVKVNHKKTVEIKL